VGNSKRFLRKFPQPGLGWPGLFLQPKERLTAIRGTTDSRHTLVDAALSRAIPKAPGPLSQKRIFQLALFVLLIVEAFPGASGLLCGQRSCRTFRP